jgi:hypothetical protein
MMPKWEVQTWTLVDGWVNCWTDTDNAGHEIPWLFPTKARAEQELVWFLQDIHEAVAAGDMQEEYDPDDYRVVEVRNARIQ